MCPHFSLLKSSGSEFSLPPKTGVINKLVLLCHPLFYSALEALWLEGTCLAVNAFMVVGKAFSMRETNDNTSPMWETIHSFLVLLTSHLQ